MRNSCSRRFSSQVSGTLQLRAELVGEALLVVRIVDQILAGVLDVHVAVGRHAVGVSAVFHEVVVAGDDVEFKAGLFDVFVERLEIAGRGQRRDHVRVDMDEVELRRARQRLRHRPLRRVEDRDVLHRAEGNSRLLGELGDHRLHRHQIRRPDHAVDVGLAGRLGRRDGLLFHGGGLRKGRCARHEIGDREPDAALQERSSRKLGHDWLLPCVGFHR